MTTAASLFHGAPFGPDVIQLMTDAFDRACRALHDTGQPDLIKEVLAKRIIKAAQDGIRDPRALCEEALKSLGLESNCE